ncbi:hypothetical protein [Mycobacterium sp. NAZ190054]|uniref:hypothetical protein n=1 Tax=Mycobacterium sp. NAZ190054 TaxID=1747766 RepID=UPI000793AF52|nr:hypothetical protein [Mycobacterium sp. NAZ190054]KWX67751.1 hypothetical protein ASJ79_04080 [Mycobacterium sp. NAZ190054]
MTSNNYCPPFNPADPTPSQIAADLIVTSGATRPGAVRDILRGYANRLVAAGAFADLTANDARTVAATIAWDVCLGDEARGLRERSAAITRGSWGGWDHPAAVAYALRTAATVLDAI